MHLEYLTEHCTNLGSSSSHSPRRRELSRRPRTHPYTAHEPAAGPSLGGGDDACVYVQTGQSSCRTPDGRGGRRALSRLSPNQALGQWAKALRGEGRTSDACARAVAGCTAACAVPGLGGRARRRGRVLESSPRAVPAQLQLQLQRTAAADGGGCRRRASSLCPTERRPPLGAVRGSVCSPSAFSLERRSVGGGKQSIWPLDEAPGSVRGSDST